MNPRRLYICECLLLLAVATPLALAEWNWLYVAAAILAAIAGWNRTVKQNRPVIGVQGSRIIVVSAFVYLIFEYFRVTAISVVALSHFMVIVCITKLLQRRSYRDHAQFFVLCLLLLVVAAIISGNLLFPVALAVFMTIGMDTLVRFHLSLERARAAQHNRQIDWSNASLSSSEADELPTTGVTSVATLAATFVGVLIFILCPRLAANSIFPRFDSPRVGNSESGFRSALNFNSIGGPIAESNRAVMRVQIEIGGVPSGELTSGPYFRGAVLTQYRYEASSSTPGWEWKRGSVAGAGGRGPIARQAEEDGFIELVPNAPIGDHSQIMVQHYFLEPAGDNQNVFTCYPALRMRSDSQVVEDVKKWVDEQVFQLPRPPTKPLRYVVESLVEMTPFMAEVLDEERIKADEEEPRVVPPDEVKRAPEILELAAQCREGLGPLDVPANRYLFAQRVRDFLRSGRFIYTLNPPAVPPDTEPISSFLLESKTGHCEYFASAMALICQLNGVPARIVVGYCGGDYNPVGNFYIVRQKHAHSWVEVFVPGMEWVTFDPTPSAPLRSGGQNRFLRTLSRYVDYLQFQWANMVVSYDADQRRTLFEKFSAWLLRPAQNEDTVPGAVIAFIRELFGWRLKLNWEERFIYWLFALLVFMLTLLIGYVVAVGLRRLGSKLVKYQNRHARRAGPPETEFYTRFCRQLDSWGIARPVGQTPAEFARELASRFPLCAEAPEVVGAYYEVAFGGLTLPDPRRNRIHAFLDRLTASDPAMMTSNPASADVR